jgi:hypothetical protein
VVWDLISKLLLKQAQRCNWILISMLDFETTIDLFWNCGHAQTYPFFFSPSHMHAWANIIPSFSSLLPLACMQTPSMLPKPRTELLWKKKWKQPCKVFYFPKKTAVRMVYNIAVRKLAASLKVSTIRKTCYWRT